jgi:hypothetical protein
MRLFEWRGGFGHLVAVRREGELPSFGIAVPTLCPRDNAERF